MTKRLHYTLEEVIDHISDDEDDYDPDEPMMEGSDDEFSDLEMDDEYDQLDLDTPPSPTALPHSSTLSSAQPHSPTLSGMSPGTPSPPGSPPQSQPPSDTASVSSPSGKYHAHSKTFTLNYDAQRDKYSTFSLCSYFFSI